jgi:hypothetical protein
MQQPVRVVLADDHDAFIEGLDIRTHVQNVLIKLDVHSKLEAAALAVRQGLVRLEDHPA